MLKIVGTAGNTCHSLQQDSYSSQLQNGIMTSWLISLKLTHYFTCFTLNGDETTVANINKIKRKCKENVRTFSLMINEAKDGKRCRTKPEFLPHICC